jgi:tetratricopeptide (TPR) repeat protein
MMRTIGWTAGWTAALLLPLLGLAPAEGGADETFVFTPEQVERSGPPSRTLQKALELYERRDFYSATILLHEVIEGQTGDAPAHRQRAQFVLGKALYHLRFYSASYAVFDQIAQRGPRHRYHRATLKWLVSLSRHLPAFTGILGRIGSYGQAEVDRPALAGVRDELRYLMGRHHYEEGRLREAVALFSAVPADSAHSARARYLQGVAQTRLGAPGAAAVAFEAALRELRRGAASAERRRLTQLTTLALARVNYALRRFERSLAYYGRVSRRGSAAWLDAVFESSWTHFQRGNYGRALGNVHTLDAPYFEQHFFPESLILKAVVYWKHCLWKRSLDAIKTFNARYPPLKRQVDRVLAQHRDAAEFFGQAKRILERRAGVGDDVGRLIRLALGDLTIKRHFEHVRELDRELGQVRRADPAWRSTAVAGMVLQDLALQRSLAQHAAGRLAQRRFARISREIQGLTKQAYKVQYETIRAQREQVRELLARGFTPAPARTRELQPDDEHYIWPFTGPYWRDELGYYHVRVRTRCHHHTPGPSSPPMATLRLSGAPRDLWF